MILTVFVLLCIDSSISDDVQIITGCTKYIQEGEEEIPLPAATPDGDTTLNELQVICRIPAERVT